MTDNGFPIKQCAARPGHQPYRWQIAGTRHLRLRPDDRVNRHPNWISSASTCARAPLIPMFHATLDAWALQRIKAKA